MNTYLFWLLFTVLLFTGSAEAQQPTKVPRIAYLGGASYAASSMRIEAFKQGLRKLGYVEGKNIIIEWRFAEEKSDRLPELAAELVRLKLDVIVSGAPPVTRSLKQATATIPIVMAFDDDPVGSGFAASLARPGGNITGLSALSPEMSGKLLDIMKEILPNLSRVGVLGDVTRPGIPQALREINVTADGFRVQVQYLDVRRAKDIDNAFRAANQESAEALVILGNPMPTVERKHLIELAAKSRLPVIYQRPEFVEAGGLATYGPAMTDLYRRAATYVDKILKGAKPADLPVEQPKKFEFLINLKSAKQIGLTIPPNVLARADKVIK